MIKVIERCGLPFHGLVIDDYLTLSNGNKVYYPGITNGDTQLISLPNPPTLSCSATQKNIDQKNGFEWPKKAIVADNHLGGINLGKDWLLYIDPNQVVWYLKLGYEISDYQCIMNCNLLSVFGRFNTSYPKVLKELAKEQTTLLYPGRLLRLNRFTFERKPDGSEVLIHVYAKFDKENSIEFPEQMSLYEIWKLEIKGSGQLSEDKGLIGTGISANLFKLKAIENIQTSYIDKIPRLEKRFRLSKENIKYEYDPKPTEPHECKTNTYRSTFDLKLVPEGSNFTPFNLDRNTYLQSNWFGENEVKISLIRMLYDSNGQLHFISIKKEMKTLNRYFQTFKGKGSGTQGPIEYYHNNFQCVVNGYLPGWVETYEGIQYVKSQYKLQHQAVICIDDKPVGKVLLEGGINQIARTITNNPVVNSVEVNVKKNGKVVRKIIGKPGDISNAVLADPFSSYHQSDHKNGVFAKFHFGLISNKLLGQFVTHLVSSDSQVIVCRDSCSLVGANISYNEVKQHPWQYYLHGSYNPISEETIRYQDNVQCWI